MWVVDIYRYASHDAVNLHTTYPIFLLVSISVQLLDAHIYRNTPRMICWSKSDQASCDVRTRRLVSVFTLD